jgi:phage terminase large subunit-like protein
VSGASELLALLGMADAELERRGAYKIRRYFPDDGPLRRELYKRHVAFMAAGKVHQERLFLAANRIGKTEAAAYEIACHLTGDYPAWWPGRTFDRPTRWWAAGDTMETTRNIPQVALLGPHDGVPMRKWEGMIEAHRIVHFTRRSGGVANCVDTIYVRHRSGGNSSLQFKSYDQGRRSFQGTELEGVWLDEEPPEAEGSQDGSSSDIYTECLLRLMTTEGLMISTFTPLRGLTGFVSQYLETAEMLDESGDGVKSAKDLLWGDQAAGDA